MKTKNLISFLACLWDITDKSKMAMDAAVTLYNAVKDDRWITTENGHRALIGEDGTIKAGFGGKYNGRNIGTLGKNNPNNPDNQANSGNNNAPKPQPNAREAGKIIKNAMPTSVIQEFNETQENLNKARENAETKAFQVNRAKSELQSYQNERLGNDRFDQNAVREGIALREKEVARTERNLKTAENRQQKAQRDFEAAENTYNNARETAMRELSGRYDFSHLSQEALRLRASELMRR